MVKILLRRRTIGRRLQSYKQRNMRLLPYLLVAVIIIQTVDCKPFQPGAKVEKFFAKLKSYVKGHPFHGVEKYIENEINKKITKEKGRLFSWSCSACKFGVSLLQDLFSQNKSKNEIIHVIQDVCIKLKLEDSRVCKDLCVEFKEEVLTVFDDLALNPDEVCGIILGDECAHKYDPFMNWNITLPKTPKPPVSTPKPPQSGSPSMRVLVLSDIHFDPLYKPGSNAECGEPLCCRTDNGPLAPGSEPAMKYGDYRNCDTNSELLASLLKHLKNQTFDYILWLGDLPPHDIWKQTKKDQLQYYSWLLNTFFTHFPGVKVFSALGNHESAPVNSFPPPFVKGNDSISWLYNDLAVAWTREGLPKATVPDIKKGGYYTTLLKPGLRIISINMNYCNNQNWWLLLNMTDPAHQLQWLMQVLQYSEDHREKVHIIGHIPPGIGDCLKAWSWNYYKIVNRYESTIVAQFFGHTHKDSFQIFYDEETLSRAVSMAYVIPSVTPYSFINSGYRIFTIDGDYNNSSWAVLDHETHILNLTKANLTNNPVWEKEYSAKETYGLQSLNPADWDKLVKRMTESNSAEFNQYYRYYYKSKEQKTKCDDNCKKSMICALKTARSHDPSVCKDLEIDHKKVLKWMRAEKVC